MSMRKLSGAAAAKSRDSSSFTGASVVSAGGAGSGNGGSERSNQAGEGASSVGTLGSSSGPGSGGVSGGAGGVGRAEKGYSSHLAIQSDATKYRGKYKELKKKVRQIEGENDRLHLKTLRIKRNIQRMRLERAILYERLEAELSLNTDVAGDVEPSFVTTSAAVGPDMDEDFVVPPQHQNQSIETSGGRSRRNIDFSPSPEEDRPSNGAASSAGALAAKSQTNGGNSTSSTPTTTIAATKAEHPARSSMKVTLKRSHHSSHNTRDNHD